MRRYTIDTRASPELDWKLGVMMWDCFVNVSRFLKLLKRHYINEEFRIRECPNIK